MKISSPLIVLQIDHGGDGVVVGLEGDLGQPLPPDDVEAVEVGEELLSAVDVGADPHGDLLVVHLAHVDQVVDLHAGAVHA